MSTSPIATELSVARVSMRFNTRQRTTGSGSARIFQRAEFEEAGQHELTIWSAHPSPISDLDKKPEVIGYIETFTLNTDSCFAVFS